MTAIEEFLESKVVEEVIVVDDQVPHALDDKVIAALVNLDEGQANELIGHAPPATDNEAEVFLKGLSAIDTAHLLRDLMARGHIVAQPDFVAPMVQSPRCLPVHTDDWQELLEEAKATARQPRLFVIDREQAGGIIGSKFVLEALKLERCEGVLYLSKDFNKANSMHDLQALLADDGLDHQQVFPFRRIDAISDDRDAHIVAGFQLAMAGHELMSVIDDLESTYNKAVEDEFRAFREGIFLLACHRLMSYAKREGEWPAETFVKYIRDRVRETFIALTSQSEGIRKSLNELMIKWTQDKEVEVLLANLNDEETPDALTFHNPSKALMPIAPGDIFEVQSTKDSGSKEYVLLGQLCDLAIRGDGKRNPQASKMAVLAPIEEIRDQDNPNTDSMWEYPAEHASSPRRAVKFGKTIQVPLDALDLCMYNEEGDATGELSDGSTSDHWHPNVAKHWPTIVNSAKNSLDELSRIATALDGADGFPAGERTALDGSYLRWPQELTPKVYFQATGRQVEYGLKRTKRLEATHATMLLERYSWYQSRPATEAPLYRSQPPICKRCTDREKEDADKAVAAAAKTPVVEAPIQPSE